MNSISSFLSILFPMIFAGAGMMRFSAVDAEGGGEAEPAGNEAQEAQNNLSDATEVDRAEGEEGQSTPPQTMSEYLAQRKAAEKASKNPAAEDEGEAESEIIQAKKTQPDALEKYLQPEDKTKYGKNVHRRIAQEAQGKLYWQSQATRLANEKAELEARLVSTQNGGEGITKPAKSATPLEVIPPGGGPADDPRPDPANFTDPQVYDEADRRWVYRDEARRIKTKEQQQQAQTTQQQQQQQVRATLDVVNLKARELFPEWSREDENGNLTAGVDNALRSILTPYMRVGIAQIGKVDAAQAAKVAHFWATNPDEAKRVAELEPFEQALEIGALRARLGNATVTSKKTAGSEPGPIQLKTAQAQPRRFLPAPLKDIRGPGAPATLDTAQSPEDFIAIRNQQIRRQRGLS